MEVGIAAMGSNLGSGGGVDVYTRYLVEALADFDRCNSYTVLLTEEAELVGTPTIEGWRYRSWPKNVRFVVLRNIEPHQPRQVRAWRRLRRVVGLPAPSKHGEQYLARQIDELGLDLVHYPRTTIFPWTVKTKCLLTLFDIQYEYYPQFFTLEELALRERRYRPSVDRAAHIIAPSQYTRQTLVEKYAAPGSKISVVPVGIADTFRRADDAEVGQLRRKYGLPPNFIYYPANTWPHKNHARLMAALRIHKEQYDSAPILVLSGRLHGNHLDAMDMAKAEGVEQQVVDLGYIPREECPALYSAASLLVFPSLFEGFGIPLVEAMACGCPIAAARATAIPDCVGDAALLFDAFDPRAIADAIYTVISDEGLRHDLVERGYRRLSLYSWKAIVSEIVQIYETLAKLRNKSGQ